MMALLAVQFSVCLVFAALLFRYSQKVKKVAIVDSFWSVFFIISSSIALLWSSAPVTTKLIVLIPELIWAVRLMLHLIIRSKGAPEDPRYIGLKNRFGGNHKNWALWIVFWPQSLLAVLINIPLTIALVHQGPWQNSGIVWFGLFCFGTGFIVEALADYQLTQFKRHRTSSEQVLDTGLWAYSRHPNYFGEAVLWWGFFFISLGVSGNPLTIFSPVIMTFLLLRVSGVVMLDKLLTETKPAYARYIKKTSAFIPWPPKKD